MGSPVFGPITLSDFNVLCTTGFSTAAVGAATVAVVGAVVGGVERED